MNIQKNILVCVTQQKTCERLIMNAESMRKEVNGTLYVIHVAKNDWNFLDNIKEGEALDYLFGISKSIGAELTVLRSDNIVGAIADFIISNKINCVVLGESPEKHQENNFSKELKNLFSDLEIYVVPQ